MDSNLFFSHLYRSVRSLFSASPMIPIVIIIVLTSRLFSPPICTNFIQRNKGLLFTDCDTQIVVLYKAKTNHFYKLCIKNDYLDHNL